MIVVTGGAGFIGSNLVEGLNRKGYRDILIVDNLKNTEKAENLLGLEFSDYMDRWEFLKTITENPTFFNENVVVFHHGACSSMVEPNGKYLMRTNYEFSKSLYMACRNRSRLIYASSCAVYDFNCDTKAEKPKNLYGISKLLFDRYVLSNPSDYQVVGLRYFCVYGPNERHKKERSSIITKGFHQVKKTGTIRLFGGFNGCSPGEQRRDFTYVGDVVDVNMWFFEHPDCSGVVEVGTGNNRSFNDAASEIIKYCGVGTVKYFDPAKEIARSYQNISRADISALRDLGYNQEFISLEDGVILTLGHLDSS